MVEITKFEFVMKEKVGNGELSYTGQKQEALPFKTLVKFDTWE